MREYDPWLRSGMGRSLVYSRAIHPRSLASLSRSRNRRIPLHIALHSDRGHSSENGPGRADMYIRSPDGHYPSLRGNDVEYPGGVSLGPPVSSSHPDPRPTSLKVGSKNVDHGRPPSSRSQYHYKIWLRLVLDLSRLQTDISSALRSTPLRPAPHGYCRS